MLVMPGGSGYRAGKPIEGWNSGDFRGPARSADASDRIACDFF
jgi:hypothetical protein